MSASYTIATAPEVEPVSRDEAKKHALMFDDLADDDDYIASLIVAAREKLEAMTCRSFVARSVMARLDGFPRGGRPIELLYPPLASVESISYLDEGGAERTLDPGDYDVEPGTTPGMVYPAVGKSWPSALRRPGSVRVAFTAGYGDAPSDVPEVARLCIKMLVAHWYDTREPVVSTGAVAGVIPYTVEALADPLRWGAYP